MKKIYLALLCMATLMSSCSFIGIGGKMKDIEDGADPDYDKYPGMNVNTEPLKGRAFVLPAGIEIENIIYGEGNQREEENQDASLAITDDMLGSGLCVIVNFNIKNVTDKNIDVTFPAGLMLQAAETSYQNGILVKDVNLTVVANTTRRISMRFYCLNSHASASSPSAMYGLSYITDIAAFQPLFNVCAVKRVNIDEYKALSILKYYSTCALVQEIVWAITQGKTFTEEEIRGFLNKVKASKD